MVHLVRFGDFTAEALDPKQLRATRPDIWTDIQRAREAVQNAHAEESDFAVGACVRTCDDVLHTAWNVETSILDVLHAEIGALGRMLPSSREAGIERITLVGLHHGRPTKLPTFPCGACCQKLSRFLAPGDDPEIISAVTRDRIYRTSLKTLAPFVFKLPGRR